MARGAAGGGIVIGVGAGKWEGLDGMGDETLRELRPRAENLVTDGAVMFVGELKSTLTGRRSGREYKVSKTGKLHVASAPGEPPAVLFGALRNSIGYRKPTWVGWTVQSEVGTGLGVNAVDNRTSSSYAARMEFGGISFHPWPVKIRPRPYMAPTALRMEPRLEKLFDRI
jgi:hypothetical protein